MWPILTARWFPYAAAGIVSVAAWAFVRGYIYTEGYNAAMAECQAQQAVAMAQQSEAMEESFRRQMRALESKARREQNARTIVDLPRPVGPGCDAGPEWLRSTEHAVRAANRAAGADITATPTADAAGADMQ